MILGNYALEKLPLKIQGVLFSFSIQSD